MRGKPYIKQLKAEVEYIQTQLGLIEEEWKTRKPNRALMETHWHTSKGKARKLYETMRKLTREKKVKF